MAHELYLKLLQNKCVISLLRDEFPEVKGISMIYDYLTQEPVESWQLPAQHVQDILLNVPLEACGIWEHHLPPNIW